MQMQPYPSMLADPFYEGNMGRTGRLGTSDLTSAENAGCPKQGAIPAWVRTSRSSAPLCHEHLFRREAGSLEQGE
jgi:hypothetical protein